jgi:hypothetical protein
MNHEELLHKYFDKTLDEQQESVLFAALSHDTELRREFNDYVSLNAAVQSDVGQYAPPAALSASVFKELGYALTPSLAEESTSATNRSSLGGMPYMVPIFIAVLSSVLTAFIVLLFVQPYSSSKPVVQEVPVAIRTEVHNDKTVEQQVAQTLPEQTTPVFIENRHRKMEANTIEPDFEMVEEMRSVSLDNEEYKRVENVELYPVEKRVFPDQNYPLSVTVKPDEMQTQSDSELGIDVSMRSFLSRSFPSVSLPTGNTNSLNNLAVTALYSLSDKEAVGVELGREEFGQEYHQTLHGETVTVRQNPALWWAGASYRRELPELALVPEMIYPYGQTTIGMSEVGPLGRLLLGVRLIPEQKIIFSFGVESSFLAYPVENQWYTTTKLGFTYGITVRF